MDAGCAASARRQRRSVIFIVGPKGILSSQMRTDTKIALSISLIIVLGVGTIIWLACTDRRSVPGHIVRRFRGETGAEQTVNDLAEDIRRIPALAQLQPWSIDALRRFRAGQLHINGESEEMPSSFVPNVRLARNERPEFIKRLWGETNSWGLEEPELLILLATNGQPECVAVNWYLHGIAVGPPDYRLSFDPYLSTVVTSGVYVYHFYK